VLRQGRSGDTAGRGRDSCGAGSATAIRTALRGSRAAILRGLTPSRGSEPNERGSASGGSGASGTPSRPVAWRAVRDQSGSGSGGSGGGSAGGVLAPLCGVSAGGCAGGCAGSPGLGALCPGARGPGVLRTDGRGGATGATGAIGASAAAGPPSASPNAGLACGTAGATDVRWASSSGRPSGPG